jgi:hypothetical protein
MVPNLDILYLYVEVIIAFVAFAAIIATLRQSFGNKLTALQYILVRWIIEVSLLLVFVAFSTIVINTVMEDAETAWRYSTFLIIFAIPAYLFSYLRRRAKLNLAMPLSSKLVSVGYFLSVLFLITTLTGLTLEPSLKTVMVYLTWGLASLLIVFLQFLSLFIDWENSDDE